MLKRPTPSPMHWMAATFLALGLSASAGYAAWAAQPAKAPLAPSGSEAGLYAIDVRMDVDGKAKALQLREHAGRTFGIRSEEPGSPVWEADLAVKPVEGDAGRVTIGGSLRADGDKVSDPVLLVALGKPATIQVSTLDGRSVITLQLNVTRLEKTGADSHTPATPAAVDGDARAAAGVPEASVQEWKPLSALKPVGRQPAPEYPVDAARAGVAGQVILLLDVDAEGRVTGVQVEKATPPGVFEASTVAAAWQWRFEPELRDGRPVAGRQRVPVTFSLDHPDAGGASAQ